jgi:type I restriction enzyme S subunit
VKAGWTDVPLGEVCDVTMGQAPKGDTYNSDGEGWPLVAGAGDFDGLHPRPSKFTTASNARLCEAGDVILGIRATIGVKVLADSVYCLGRGVAGLRPMAALDARFLWNWLDHVAPQLAGKGRGATFKQVNKADIADLVVPLPPIDEQQRIAAVLDAADALRAKRRQALAKLDTLTQSWCTVAFNSFVDAAPLGDYVEFLTSGARGWAKYYSDSGSRFIRSLDVQMNSIGEGDLAFVDPPDSAEAGRIRVSSGDILLTITGSRIGRVAVASPDVDGAFISQHVAIVRVDTDRLLPEFVSRFLSLASKGQRQIAARQYGQTKPGLNFDQIRSFILPVPDIGEQRHLLNGIRELRQAAERCSESERAMDILFASLQQRAFRGEL